jgi:hypothetical protein
LKPTVKSQPNVESWLQNWTTRGIDISVGTYARSCYKDELSCRENFGKLYYTAILDHFYNNECYLETLNIVTNGSEAFEKIFDLRQNHKWTLFYISILSESASIMIGSSDYGAGYIIDLDYLGAGKNEPEFRIRKCANVASGENCITVYSEVIYKIFKHNEHFFNFLLNVPGDSALRWW